MNDSTAPRTANPQAGRSARSTWLEPSMEPRDEPVERTVHDMTDLLDCRSKLNVIAYRRWAREDRPDEVHYSVIIPTYNEEWRIVPTIGAIANHMSSLRSTWELIVSDDGSTDTTVELVQNLNLPGLCLLVADRNRGKGAAVRRGVLEARGQVILFADADQSTPIEQFGLLEAELEKGHEVVVASRHAVDADVVNKSLLRDLMSKGLRLVVRAFLGVPVSDTQCGFKLFSRNAAWDVFGRQTIEGFSFDLEILYVADRLSYSISEVPIKWYDAPGSKVASLKVAGRFLVDIFRIRRRAARGQYDRSLPEEIERRRVVSRPVEDSRPSEPSGVQADRGGDRGASRRVKKSGGMPMEVSN